MTNSVHRDDKVAASGRSARNRFDRMEWAGAFGDLGSLIPFAVAYISVLKMDPFGILFSFGAAMVICGSYYKTPFPVQPILRIVEPAQAARIERGKPSAPDQRDQHIARVYLVLKHREPVGPGADFLHVHKYIAFAKPAAQPVIEQPGIGRTVSAAIADEDAWHVWEFDPDYDRRFRRLAPATKRSAVLAGCRFGTEFF
jgi:Molybdate transporter of MFS superfamily